MTNPADGRTLPVVLGLSGGQIFDPDARIHIWLPALADAQWSELKPSLQSLATLGSLPIAARHVVGADCPNHQDFEGGATGLVKDDHTRR